MKRGQETYLCESLAGGRDKPKKEGLKSEGPLADYRDTLYLLMICNDIG